MFDRLSLKYVGTALFVAVSFGSTSPALAGFQWVAPSESAPLQAAPAPQDQAPSSRYGAATSGPEIISPVVITGNSSVAAPLTIVPPVSAQVQEPAPAPASVAAPSAPDNSIVLGFARSVPLAVALRQILPSGYAFSIDQDVDMGTLVSFQGGCSWRDTLREALDPVGLIFHEHGQMVSIGFAGHVMPSAPMPSPVRIAQSTQPQPVFQPGEGPAVLNVPPAQPAVAVPAAPSMQMTAGSISSLPVTESWTAERGDTLRKVLAEWSRRANVEFDWLSEYDYPLEASVSFSGGFEGAVRSLLTGFEGAHPQPVAELHANSNLGQMVLVVQTRGNTNSD